MSTKPPPDDDQVAEFEARPTTIDLLPDDLRELEEEPKTPTSPVPPSLIDYERSQAKIARDERDRVLAAVGAILSSSHRVGAREVAEFLDLVRQKLNHPGGG